MENYIKCIEAFFKLESPIDYIVGLTIGCALIMFIPSDILLAYPSKALIDTCEYIKYIPYVFVILTSIILTKIIKWILGKVEMVYNDWSNRHKAENVKINYLLSLDIVRMSIISDFYNRKNNIRKLDRTDRLTYEFLGNDIIKWVPNLDGYSWDRSEYYILNKWVIDAINNNQKVHNYFVNTFSDTEPEKNTK